MKIYVVITQSFEDVEFIQAYKSKRKAEKFVKDANSKRTDPYDAHYRVEEVDLLE